MPLAELGTLHSSMEKNPDWGGTLLDRILGPSSESRGTSHPTGKPVSERREGGRRARSSSEVGTVAGTLPEAAG